MKCARCKAKVELGARFCVYCGAAAADEARLAWDDPLLAVASDPPMRRKYRLLQSWYREHVLDADYGFSFRKGPRPVGSLLAPEAVADAPDLNFLCDDSFLRYVDQRVPEEINRRIVDHTADVNLTYSDIAREYLLAEGPNGEIVFTQQDVRALQLAKGAIATGWSLLLQRAGVRLEDLRTVFVAGAFGNYLDVHNSLRIGLLPPVPAARVAFVGNAAGVGVEMALLDVRARRRIAALRARIGFLELATDKSFHEAFAARLGFA